ncbi:hypothetical protein, partial [Klebsiella pneumoniae]|uniref:hypothetical protein n=1 Tax=Klebsiella pneumoniae TaxID=573 RepID=UPI00197B03BA
LPFIYRYGFFKLNIHWENPGGLEPLPNHARKNAAGGAGTPPLSGSVRYFRGRHPTCQKQPVPPGAGILVKAFPAFQSFHYQNHIKRL